VQIATFKQQNVFQKGLVAPPFSRRATTLIESSQITNYLPPDRYVISVAGLIWAIDLLFKPEPGMIMVLGGGQAPPLLSRQFRETGSKLRPKLSA
jgi:hypothetical protein